MKNKEVYRFTAGGRYLHWSHAISFILLLFTGLGVLSIIFQPWMNIFGGIAVTKLIHRIVAVFFTVSVILAFIIGEGGRQLRRWIKDAVAFDADDFAHAKNFPIEFFGGHKPFPPQGKFNGGEKINSLITVTGMLFMGITGYIMWFAWAFPQWLVQWCYPIHAGFALLLAALFMAHFYLGVLHPDSNQALKGIINGWVPSKFAYEHYEEWYLNEVKDTQEREVV